MLERFYHENPYTKAQNYKNTRSHIFLTCFAGFTKYSLVLNKSISQIVTRFNFRLPTFYKSSSSFKWNPYIWVYRVNLLFIIFRDIWSVSPEPASNCDQSLNPNAQEKGHNFLSFSIYYMFSKWMIPAVFLQSLEFTFFIPRRPFWLAYSFSSFLQLEK